MTFDEMKKLEMGQLCDELNKCLNIKSQIEQDYVRAAKFDLKYKAADDIERLLRYCIAIKVEM